ncbi:PREDICTED: putative B3 domain-containing protein At2g18810 [Camelina sativa]|uniref:B3 domain-containing protein At2g18810 n=1 Tax=Camelina sativa TaxID=90675 RepID=A0ABM1R2J2_CAMSA|nr:PREDICTED: putative B3 domain-containing protein At2g18810 [Camelina sativa]
MERVDDDQLKRLQGEKRSFDILSLAMERIMVKPFTYYGEKEESSTEADHASVKDSKREMERITMSSCSSGKRQKMIHGCEDHKQNPNHDACSTSLCHVESKRCGQVVTNKKDKIREPVEERGMTPEWLVKVMREENGTDVKMIKKKDLGKRWGLNLRRWDMGSNSNYVLASGWNKVAAENELEIGQTLRIWSFRTLGNKVVAGADRTPDKLFIAFAPLDPAPAPDLVRVPAPSSPPAQAEAQEESDRVFPVPYNNWEDLNILAEVCERTTHLEALQEADRRSSLVPVTKLDLELRL